MKTLVVYYSLSGNTKRIAEMIQKEIGGDIAQIDTVTPYTGDYNAIVKQGNDEVNRGFMPEIKPLRVNPGDYDTIVIGTPVWWYTYAPAVKTFLENTDFSGKTVYPFAINGGWIGHTFEDYKTACGGAEVKPGLNIRFDENNLRTPEAAIVSWTKKING